MSALNQQNVLGLMYARGIWQPEDVLIDLGGMMNKT
jgi:hypothetical protein